MRVLYTLVVAALVAPSAASANELARMYDLAVKNDPTLRAARGIRTQGTETASQARGQLLPQISGTGTDWEGESTSSFNGAEQDSDDAETILQVNLRQALFDATAWNRWQQAQANADASRANYRIAEQDLIVRTATAYFALLGTADNLRFADAEKKAVERTLELNKKRFEVGLSAITDVQEAQARYDLAVAAMIDAEQAHEIAKVQLAEITADSSTRIVPLREEIPLLGPTPDSVNDWLKASSQNSNAIAVARAQLESAEQGVDLAWAGHYPTLNLVARQQNYESTSVTVIGPTDQESDSLMYGFQVAVPIFAGFSTQAGVNVAKGVREQRAAELEAQKRATERATRNAYQGVVAGVARVNALKQAVVSNTTALEASDVGLEVGARTAVDVLNAQRELFAAQRDYARSRYDYLLNILRLKALAGQLTRKDLLEIDALLTTEASAPATTTPPKG